MERIPKDGESRSTNPITEGGPEISRPVGPADLGRGYLQEMEALRDAAHRARPPADEGDNDTGQWLRDPDATPERILIEQDEADRDKRSAEQS